MQQMFHTTAVHSLAEFDYYAWRYDVDQRISLVSTSVISAWMMNDQALIAS